MPVTKAEIPDHLAFTLHYALEDYEVGWATWQEVEDRVRQEAEYLQQIAASE